MKNDKNGIVQHAGHPYYLSRNDWKIGFNICPDEKTEIQDAIFGKGDDEYWPYPSIKPEEIIIRIHLGSILNHRPIITLDPKYHIKEKKLTKTHLWKQEGGGTIQCWKLTGIIK